MTSLRLATLFLAASSVAAFAPPIVQTRASASRLWQAVGDDFDNMVNKNKKGAKEDVQERSERISLDITKTQYTSLVKSAPDAYITFAEKGQLFTGNSATVAAAKFEGFVSWKDLWSNWVISLGGNVVGCGLFAVATIIAQVMNPGATTLCVNTAIGKCGVGLIPTIMRAIMCNWMVSMAVFLSGAANDMTGKLVGCWFPISTFVGIGLEHSIANLFILPLALLLGGTGLTISDIIIKNLIPVVIGNGIAGALIVAASYSYQFGRLGGLRRAVFAEKLANIQKQLAKQRREMDKQLQQEVDDILENN
eukprot:scaffold115_cov172-Amphora_coffeaeformis.AAC.13